MVSDCLSRPINAILIDTCDLPEISKLQSPDDEIVHFADRLREYNISQGGCEILCDISTPYPSPFVPKLARKSILDSFYNISHPGIKSI